MKEEEKEELRKVIADFLELGHVDNIAAMFRQNRELYQLTGVLLRDERFAVRLGVAVLFEIMAEERPEETQDAIPHLAPLLFEQTPYIRGEAVNVLGIIGSEAALDLLRAHTYDPDPQVREIIADFIPDG